MTKRTPVPFKADCLAIVDESNAVRWVRSAAYPLSNAAQALQSLRSADPQSSLELIKSFVDQGGVEQFVEIATPWADAYLAKAASGPVDCDSEPGKAVVEVWHDNQPMFGLAGTPKELDPTKFTRCADLVVPYDKHDVDQSLDLCYRDTQNISKAWRPGKKGCRSTSVGDVLVVCSVDGCVAFVVASFGFSPVEFGDAQSGPGKLSPYRAEAYLRRLGASEKIADSYDDDEMLRSALISVIPDFEYPDWSHKTMADVLKHVFP